MAFIPVGHAGIILPVQGASGGSSPAITWAVETAGFGGTDPEIPDAVWGVFELELLPFLDSSRVWGPITANVGVTGGTVPEIGSESEVGGAAINSVPPNTAVLVSKVSSTPGRKGRGRFYWPFMADRSGVDEQGVWDGFDETQTRMDNFLDGLAAASLPMEILHTAEITPSLVNALIVRSPLATQRRRMRA